MRILIWVLVVLDGLLLMAFVFFIARLRRLWGTVRSVEDIERMIEPLGGFLEQVGQTGAEMEQNLSERRQIMARLMSGLDEKSARLRELIDEAETTLARASREVQPPPQPVARSSSLPSNHREVLALADQGRTVEQISAELSIPRGEVQLIVDLHRKL
jgi:DNA-directed RNA polymerase specialized sigma24 family protein